MEPHANVTFHFGRGAATRGNLFAMSNLSRIHPAREPITDHEQKKVALGYVHEAWAEARLDGVDGDCMAQACLFAALIEFVSTYGEDAASTFAEKLPARIRNGEFSADLSKQ
jgi:hypothetical protein